MNTNISAWIEGMTDGEKAKLEALITKLERSGRNLKPTVVYQQKRNDSRTDPYLVEDLTSRQFTHAQVMEIDLSGPPPEYKVVATVNLGFVLTVEANEPPVLLLLSSSLVALQENFGLPFDQVYKEAVTAWARSVAETPGPEERYPAVIVVVDSNEGSDNIAQRLAALEIASAVSPGKDSILGNQFSISYGLDNDTGEFSFRIRCIHIATGTIDFYAIGPEAEDLLQRIDGHRSMSLEEAMEIVTQPYPTSRKKTGFFGRLSGLFGR